MNCHRAVFFPLSRLLADIVVFFQPSDFYRPFPELIYRISFALFGHDLLPLRILLFLIMGANLVLAYQFGKRLTGSREAGILLALLSSTHMNLTSYYFNTGQLYDIFCYFFYFLGLVYYLGIRRQGRRLRWLETLALCGLYILALDSKELAVSFPVALAAFELLHTLPPLRLRPLLDWARRDLAPVWLTAVMTAAYIPGRVLASSGLAHTSGYTLEVSLANYLKSAGFYLGELFYKTGYFDIRRTLAVALLLLLGALWLRSRALAFCWILYFAGLLPMAFIGTRGLTAVWIPTAGLLLYGAIVVTGLRDAALQRLRLGFLRPAAQVGLFLLTGWFLLHTHTGIRGLWESWQEEYGSIRNLRSAMLRFCPAMPKGARMLFVTDPLNGTYSTVFLVQLLYRDSTSRVDQLFRFDPKPSPSELAQYQYVFDFVDGRLIQLDPEEYARGSAAPLPPDSQRRE